MERCAVLLAPCILSPGLQASPKPGTHWGYPVLQLIMRYGVDIIPLPCAECTFGGLSNGLRRKPHSIRYYQSLDGYTEYCEILAERVVKQILQMSTSGYRFLCVLGVENSPTCAISHIYTNHGTVKQKGIFFKHLEEKLIHNNLTIPFIGITRRKNSPIAYAKLEELLNRAVVFQSDEKTGD